MFFVISVYMKWFSYRGGLERLICIENTTFLFMEALYFKQKQFPQKLRYRQRLALVWFHNAIHRSCKFKEWNTSLFLSVMYVIYIYFWTASVISQIKCCLLMTEKVQNGINNIKKRCRLDISHKYKFSVHLVIRWSLEAAQLKNFFIPKCLFPISTKLALERLSLGPLYNWWAQSLCTIFENRLVSVSRPLRFYIVILRNCNHAMNKF